MLRIQDPGTLGSGRLVTDLPPAGQAGELPAPPSACVRCAAHAPDPQLDGNLQVDPDIKTEGVNG